MNREHLQKLLQDYRYPIYQLMFILIFGFVFPFLMGDVPSLIGNPHKIIHLGIMGLIAILADTIGSVIKARELQHVYSYSSARSVGWFFVIFWIFRAGVVMFGGMVTIVGLTGVEAGDKNAFGMGVAIVESLRWLIMGFIIHQIITEGKSVKISTKTKVIGDALILYSSAFYLSAMWMSINFSRTAWSDMHKSEKWEYAIAGFVLFLMIYVPATFYHFLENLVRSKSRKEKWMFWLGILITGIMALVYPMIF